MDSTVRFALLGFAVAVLAALPAAAGEKVTVYTVSYPLQYFTERIGGGAVEVVFPAPADVDPAWWMPDADTVAAYQRADLIILNGANYAKWTGKVTLPRGKMVNTSSKFREEYITSDKETTHSHGPGGGIRPRESCLHHLARSRPCLPPGGADRRGAVEEGAGEEGRLRGELRNPEKGSAGDR